MSEFRKFFFFSERTACFRRYVVNLKNIFHFRIELFQKVYRSFLDGFGFSMILLDVAVCAASADILWANCATSSWI